MSGLPQNPNREQVLAELERVLASSYFRNKERPPQILKYIVEKALAGDKVKEVDIGREVCGRPDFDPKIDALVRVAVRNIRDDLGKYYANEGRTNPLRIDLPPKTYAPTLTNVSQPVPIPSVPPLAPEERMPVIGKAPRPISKRQLFVAGALFIVGALVVFFLWFGQDCTGSISITSPAKDDKVLHTQTVTGKRDPKKWYSRCKCYLVVEAVDLKQWYIQGPLTDGPDWSLTATFGDPNTDPKTRFNLFVLTTTQDLRPGPSPQIEGGQSASVSVTRKGP